MEPLPIVHCPLGRAVSDTIDLIHCVKKSSSALFPKPIEECFLSSLRAIGFCLVLLSTSPCRAFHDKTDGESGPASCKNRILHLEDAQTAMLRRIEQLNRDLEEDATLNAPEKADLFFQIAREYWTHGRTVYSEEVKESLDRALALSPMHFGAKCLIVKYLVDEQDRGADVYAISEALPHIGELLDFPEVKKDPELALMLRNYAKFLVELEESVNATRPERLAAQTEGDADVDRLPVDFGSDPSTQAAFDALQSKLNELQAKVRQHKSLAHRIDERGLPTDLLASYDAFAIRLDYLIFSGRSGQAFQELNQIILDSYAYSSGLSSSARADVLAAALNLTDQISEHRQSDLAGIGLWAASIYSRLKSDRAEALAWSELYIAGLVSSGDQAKELLRRAIRLAEGSSPGPLDTTTEEMDELIQTTLERAVEDVP
jgi:hypothetical protein